MSSIYRTEKTPTGFLDDLSRPDFNEQLEIVQVRDRTGTSYKVTEIANYNRFNPLRLFASPQPNATKLQLATNLIDFLKKHERTLYHYKDTELDTMAKHVENMGNNLPQATSAKFSEAATLIKASKLKKNTAFYAEDRGILDPKNKVKKVDDFYKELTNAGWLSLFGGFNKRIVIKKPSTGELEIYTPERLWFYQRCFNKPVVAAEKLASMHNLNKMIKSHRALITQNRYDVGVAISYFEKLLISMVRNCTPLEKLAIENELKEIIAELKYDQKDIVASKSNDLWRVVGGGIMAAVNFIRNPFAG